MNQSSIPPALPFHTSGRAESFPSRLRRMLDDAFFEDIVAWVGTAHFRVFEPKRFEREVLHLYFDSTKYKSFTRYEFVDANGNARPQSSLTHGYCVVLVDKRQLNLYRFYRICNKRSPYEGCYCHPLFQRDRPELAEGIGRHHSGGFSSDQQQTDPMSVGPEVYPSTSTSESPTRMLDSFPERQRLKTFSSNRGMPECGTSRHDEPAIFLSEPATPPKNGPGGSPKPMENRPVEPPHNATRKLQSTDSNMFHDWARTVPGDIQDEIVDTFLHPKPRSKPPPGS